MQFNSDANTDSVSAHGRMTRVVGFELPITEETINMLLATEPESPETLSETSIDPGLLAVIHSEVKDDDYGLFMADAGRGASGYAVALEVVRLVADVGGAIATVAGGVHVARRLHQKLCDYLGALPSYRLAPHVSSQPRT